MISDCLAPVVPSGKVRAINQRMARKVFGFNNDELTASHTTGVKPIMKTDMRKKDSDETELASCRGCDADGDTFAFPCFSSSLS
jgi:hypothetical protein